MSAVADSQQGMKSQVQDVHDFSPASGKAVWSCGCCAGISKHNTYTTRTLHYCAAPMCSPLLQSSSCTRPARRDAPPMQILCVLIRR
ncbi:hypothetical protein BDP81DRAFT_421765 [Colletotrichum phormii]|uniref:Uncharacterized protein n=1 Tax=Colletotrichum phormii TaxID=359342 RepID=A0AAJ0EGV2_9PEZI|nr:uncharacterized protein BDP81DRAFT_421765 [Colletotrichum phormii]KAK1639742.1 hypothetical protein BDP81DRAFT_421765 [Colletotrichum phormii]